MRMSDCRLAALAVALSSVLAACGGGGGGDAATPAAGDAATPKQIDVSGKVDLPGYAETGVRWIRIRDPNSSTALYE